MAVKTLNEFEKNTNLSDVNSLSRASELSHFIYSFSEVKSQNRVSGSEVLRMESKYCISKQPIAPRH